jgi:hypothetical protein
MRSGPDVERPRSSLPALEPVLNARRGSAVDADQEFAPGASGQTSPSIK